MTGRIGANVLLTVLGNAVDPGPSYRQPSTVVRHAVTPKRMNLVMVSARTASIRTGPHGRIVLSLAVEASKTVPVM